MLIKLGCEMQRIGRLTLNLKLWVDSGLLNDRRCCTVRGLSVVLTECTEHAWQSSSTTYRSARHFWLRGWYRDIIFQPCFCLKQWGSNNVLRIIPFFIVSARFVFVLLWSHHLFFSFSFFCTRSSRSFHSCWCWILLSCTASCWFEDHGFDISWAVFCFFFPPHSLCIPFFTWIY